jgi:cysteine desulfurase family protein (TIGR01976 family)
MSTAALVAEKPATAFPAEAFRAQFPAVVNAQPFVFFDNAAGAQLPQNVLDEVNRHLLGHNVQRGGRYAKSVEVDRVVADARVKVAALLNAYHPHEVCFGMNATSFIRLVSLAIGQTLKPERSEIIVTDLDHDADIATWAALRPLGAQIKVWKMRDDCRLYVEDLLPLLSEKTRLVACNVVSHALGSLTDITAVAHAAHAVGAEVFLDCVHFTPHALIDVQAWECDYLVCSGYKAFSPHMGFLWGRFDKLVALPTFREEFIPDEPPFKIEAGTFIYENVAGMSSVIDYLEAMADKVSPTPLNDRRAKIVAAMNAIQAYEQTLSEKMLAALNDVGATIYGVGDPARANLRVPTFCFNLGDLHPADVVVKAAEAEIGIRDGHMYAPRLMARLGLSMDRGAVRASLVHYNTHAEIDRFAGFLKSLV